jgi:hypothetical protein
MVLKIKCEIVKIFGFKKVGSSPIGRLKNMNLDMTLNRMLLDVNASPECLF